MSATRVSASAVEESARRVTRVLDDLAVPRDGAEGCGVALLGGNTPEFLAVFRGATWSGRYCTSMSWRWTPDDVAYVAENCEARALFADARWPELAAAAAPRFPDDARFAIGGDLPGFRPWSDVAATPAVPLHPATAGAPMLYTSGTTGRPKGVRRPLTGRPVPTDMAAGGAAMLTRFLADPQLASEAPHLVTCPLYHSGPMAYCDGALHLGADIVLMDRFDGEEFLRLVEEHRPASTFLVPAQFVRLLRLPAEVRDRYDLSSLKLVVHGSAPVSVEVKRSMIEWLGPILFEFYGGTEGGGIGIDSRTWLTKPGSVGKPFRPELQVQILDEHGAPAPPGQEGLVYFREDGRDGFAYKDDPEKTEAAWRDGAFTLGDIGYLDDDGFLFLCDRRTDVIISGGVNIYPAQVESVLLGHPGVADCCVVGVPDDEWGESVRAVVQPTEASAEDAAGILAFCRERLAGYQVPRAVDFVDELPRTETGKLARRTVRDRYWEGRARRI
ncbi:MAG: AMP-binding protein [Acidimicrobiia bacterium]